jgi:hypothetical protein
MSTMRTFTQKPEASQRTASAKSTVPSEAHIGQGLEVNSIHHLQRTIGNQAVQRMLQTDAPEHEAGLTRSALPRFAHDLSRIRIHPPEAAVQTKLTISKPGDSYEQEADRLTDQVMRTPESRLQPPCPCGRGCPKCQSKQPGREHKSLPTSRVQAGDLGQMTAPPIVHEVLGSPGRSLDPELRAFMEPRFGHDFSRVRVHSDAAAAQSAHGVNARAYTVGQNIVFGAGSFAPGTREGRRLIAHELAHVVQQTGASPVGALQRQPDSRKDEPAKPQKDASPQAAPPPKAALPDLVVLLSRDDKDSLALATVIAPGAQILRPTSIEDLARQLKAIKGPIGTIYFVGHSLDEGAALGFERPGVKDYVPAERIAKLIRGSIQVESLDFRGCNVAQQPAEVDKIRLALKGTKATGSTCTLVTQASDPIKTAGGVEITKPEQLKDPKVKAQFVAGLKKVRELFADKKKNCIINDTEDGYFKTGGKLIARWANPESIADDTGWDDTKSICYDKLRTEKLDPTKKIPVIDPNDCKLIEVGTKQP